MNSIEVRKLLCLGLCLSFGLYVYIVFNVALVNDDYMALYTTWLMSSGKVPEVDFNVDSYTLLFDWMAPIYYLIGEQFEIVYVFRSVFLLVLCAISCQVYVLIRYFFSINIALTTLLLLFSSSAMIARGIDLRPDLIILFLWLQTIIILYVQRNSDAKKMFWAGFFLALAILFKFKAILICAVIGVYELARLSEKWSIRALIIDFCALLSGVALCAVLSTATIGLPSLNLFFDTTRDLFFYSSTHNSDGNSLKFNVLVQYFIRDILFWLLVLTGMRISIIERRTLSSIQRQCLIVVFLLVVLSIAANPHYHAYNLVTLYPLVALFVAFSVQYAVTSTEKWTKARVSFYIAVFVILLVRAGQYPIRHSNEHQIALQTFIEQQTQKDDAVFAFEGIGLFRPSTYHWRTSAIKIENYHGGNYNVWDQLQEVKPILVIENYRVPSWLLENDHHQLYQHYVSIAPSLLTLGLLTESSVKGKLLRSGWYVIESDKTESCFIDGSEVAVGEKLWLDKGSHVLMTEKGSCTLHWSFPIDAITTLSQSNIDGRPYLFIP
ncbi:glycosyltransferase family 39 protein [Vibrio sp. F74]|uniref:glycosyltransferase family 39 protein n=1 Tax=Vibrio sp. F74 TaxID=700020 RepID=UPI0035F56BF3